MAIVKKIGRLFRIETRFEAWVVIYAIALGAVERGQHYIAAYPGVSGYILAFACTGVVFLAGARLLDSIPRAVPAVAGVSGSPPRARRSRFGSRSRTWSRTGSLEATPPRGHQAASPEDRTHTPDY